MRKLIAMVLTVLTLGLVGCSEPTDTMRLEKGVSALMR